MHSKDYAFEGLYYYLAPDFSTFSPNTILVAMGQVFYSLSLGFGIMLTFGSYLSKKINLVNAACSTGFFTFLISFIAGSVIIPASFLYTNGNPAVLGSGSIFSSLPMVFQTIPLGWIIGAIFFILLFFAALTSNIAALEVVVAAFKDRFGIKRPVTVLIGTVYTLAIGSIICLGYGPLSWIHIGDLHLLEIFDKISGDFLLPVIALLVCIMVGFFLKRDVILDELKLFTRFRHDKLYPFMIKYFCPICIIIIFISNIIGAFL
ncbi:MAG TPA: sodium-dependent transporter [Methanocorpusculum sp.]|nr:sodium-dependent transporter [Methanocorpusculum sp.]